MKPFSSVEISSGSRFRNVSIVITLRTYSTVVTSSAGNFVQISEFDLKAHTRQNYYLTCTKLRATKVMAILYASSDEMWRYLPIS